MVTIELPTAASASLPLNKYMDKISSHKSLKIALSNAEYWGKSYISYAVHFAKKNHNM
jgi:hypothetical protein